MELQLLGEAQRLFEHRDRLLIAGERQEPPELTSDQSIGSVRFVAGEPMVGMSGTLDGLIEVALLEGDRSYTRLRARSRVGLTGLFKES
ncbi:MAG TPA: hypothetical protein VN970_04890, partial [Thermoanaerobaculia bacterium]|nr:hypothetical protein [Thermoanaerobaculia bacterium]